VRAFQRGRKFLEKRGISCPQMANLVILGLAGADDNLDQRLKEVNGSRVEGPENKGQKERSG
jgi:hypothetical protein